MFPDVASIWTLVLREPLVLPVGTPLRFLRPLRFSLYRASDGLWYLGARDWNAATQRFNTVQPVAGPLRPYSADPAASGLSFAYVDGTGSPLSGSAESHRIAGVRIVARGDSRRVIRVPGRIRGVGASQDSASRFVPLRNAR